MTARILTFRPKDPSQHPERRSLTPVPPHIERCFDPETDPEFRAWRERMRAWIVPPPPLSNVIVTDITDPGA